MAQQLHALLAPPMLSPPMLRNRHSRLCASCSVDSPQTVTEVSLDSIPSLLLDESDPASVLDPISRHKHANANVTLQPELQPELSKLWRLAFPKQPFQDSSSDWLLLGFQSEDPKRDLRAAGLVGIRQLTHFCRSSGHAAFLCCTRSHSDFPLAVASLNVSLLVMQHFGLCTTSGGSVALPPCSDTTLRHAARLQLALPSGSDVSLLDLIHEHLTRWLYDRWQEVSAGQQPTALLLLNKFPQLLRAAGERLQYGLAQVPLPWSLASVLIALREERQPLRDADEDGAACACRCRPRKAL